MKRSSRIDILRQPDYWLISVVAVLLTLGLIMVYSASGPFNFVNSLPETYVLQKHLVRLLIGAAVMYGVSRLDYRVLQKWPIPLLIAVVPLALLAVLWISDIVNPVQGANRWVFHDLLGNSVQPSELAKPAIIVYMAAWIASKGSKIRAVSYGLIPFSVLLGAMTGLILVQPNLSTALLIALTAVAMLYIAGADSKQIAVLVVVATLALVPIILHMQYMSDRVTDFVSSWSSSFVGSVADASQTDQATTALVSGGLFGTGLGGSRFKALFFTVAHTDLIMAVAGEELGLLGSLLIVGLFALFAYRGLQISIQAPDTFGCLLGVGLTFWIVTQALIHAGVVCQMLPNTGMPLPFISYGGSALVSEMAAVGILINISKNAALEGERENARLAFGRRNRWPRLSSAHRG